MGQSKEKVSNEIKSLVEKDTLDPKILERIMLYKLVDRVADKVQEIRNKSL